MGFLESKNESEINPHAVIWVLSCENVSDLLCIVNIKLNMYINPHCSKYSEVPGFNMVKAEREKSDQTAQMHMLIRTPTLYRAFLIIITP